ATLIVAGEMLMRPVAEIGKGHRQNLVAPLDERERQAHRAARGAFLFLEIPLAALARGVLRPAIADGALRRDNIAGDLVERRRLPFGMLGLIEFVRKIASPQCAIGNPAIAPPLE